MEQKQWVQPGWLYVCATPIGNLEDITLRVLHTFEQVDFIACEDTRHTLALLNHFSVKKPLVSYHEHNERTSAQKIAERLRAGESCALVSDAGLPGISDPGAVIVQYCIEESIPFTVLPGACAATTALVLSGLENRTFRFLGFLAREGKERREQFTMLENEKDTCVIYESPLRVSRTLKDLAGRMPQRRVCVARELTKVHETLFRATVAEAAEHFDGQTVKGEIVLVIEGGEGEQETHDPGISPGERLTALLAGGCSLKEAAKQLDGVCGMRKNEWYQLGLSMDRE